MRLASEIKELLCAENNAGRWESIIDAKLEPVRDALQKMVHGDDPQCKCPACKYGKPVLAKLFEDE